MIYVIRHGESNTGRRLRCKIPEGDLTAQGREQARQVAGWLADRDVTRLMYSPFHRAQQTATIIARTLQIQPESDSDLAELDCGELEGRDDNYSWGRWEQIYRRWLRGEWDAGYPGGETFRQAYDRLLRAIMNATGDENVALITHGGVMRSVIPYLCVNAAALQRVDQPSNTGIIILDPYDHGRYVCESWNLIEHLH